MSGELGDALEREMVLVVRVALRWMIGMVFEGGVEAIILFFAGSRMYYFECRGGN